MITQAINIYDIIIAKATYLGDVVLLAMRLWIANIFWKSGVTKFNDWETTLILFEYEHPVPLLSPTFAAYSGTFIELAAPIALLLGLGTRLAALPLLAMTAVIQFTYLDHEQHVYWAFLLFTLLSFGPGRIALDSWVKRLVAKKFSA